MTNEDSKVLHSSGHPDLTTAPKPEAGIAYKKRKGKDDCRVKTRNKEEKDWPFTTFVKFIQAKATTTRLQLVGLATAQEREGNI